ncbi:MAG: UPF0271 protein [Limimaricola cinnabarinus]|jgi:UPF0271 protein|uniref:5-oxoprolinase subunit PxpA n=1 Tax=Limimaricola cinnabarinus TaxID=1125964 RepID=UPI0039E6CFFE
MTRSVDLNCDMGEGFGQWRLGETEDAALMPLISSANIATGFHAGDPNVMDEVVALAVSHGVALGAHPGYRDLQGFGRRSIRAPDAELINDIVYQVGALQAFATRHGQALQHIKPHGALFMDIAASARFSEALIETLSRVAPGAILFCMEASETYRAARAAGHPVVREFFADRDYDDSGAIVFARKVERPDPAAIAEKCLRACRDGVVRTVSGTEIEIGFDSICFHSDTPGALDIGRAIRDRLETHGIRIAPAAQVIGQA